MIKFWSSVDSSFVDFRYALNVYCVRKRTGKHDHDFRKKNPLFVLYKSLEKNQYLDKIQHLDDDALTNTVRNQNAFKHARTCSNTLRLEETRYIKQ